jgi:hypothetical protein
MQAEAGDEQNGDRAGKPAVAWWFDLTWEKTKNAAAKRAASSNRLPNVFKATTMYVLLSTAA